MGIPCIEEHVVDGVLSCDICIPELGRYLPSASSSAQVKDVAIDLHGYMHYTRNA